MIIDDFAIIMSVRARNCVFISIEVSSIIVSVDIYWTLIFVISPCIAIPIVIIFTIGILIVVVINCFSVIFPVNQKLLGLLDILQNFRSLLFCHHIFVIVIVPRIYLIVNNFSILVSNEFSLFLKVVVKTDSFFRVLEIVAHQYQTKLLVKHSQNSYNIEQDQNGYTSIQYRLWEVAIEVVIINIPHQTKYDKNDETKLVKADTKIMDREAQFILGLWIFFIQTFQDFISSSIGSVNNQDNEINDTDWQDYVIAIVLVEKQR